MGAVKQPDGTWKDEATATAGTSVKRTARPEMPCEACIHREVCSIKAAVETVPITVPDRPSTWPPAVQLQLTMKVECAMFRPERKMRDGRAMWTPERRAAQADRLRAFNAKRNAA